MRTEKECKASERYLWTASYLSEQAILIFQEECIRKCMEKPPCRAYEQFIHWKAKENEIAVFTLYAYADFLVPKIFDCIFNFDDPREYIRESYELTQAIWEGWFPSDSIEDGHKHLCILTFASAVPVIFNRLHQENEGFSTIPKNSFKLGICNYSDLQAITSRWEMVAQLKEKHGERGPDHECD